jgi:hypothetical protein
VLIAQGVRFIHQTTEFQRKEFREHEVCNLPQPKVGTQMRARRIEFLETKAIQITYQIIPQRQSVRKGRRGPNQVLQIPLQATKM